MNLDANVLVGTFRKSQSILRLVRQMLLFRSLTMTFLKSVPLVDFALTFLAPFPLSF